MTRPEIEDFASATMPGRSTAKDFPTFKPADKQQGFRFGDVKNFTIHFSLFKLDVLTNPLRDRMVWINHPKTLSFISLSPC